MLAPLKIAVLALALSTTAAAQTISKGGIVNAANYGPRLARHSIASLFGEDLAPQTCSADTIPLPTDLCGVTVKVRDSVGAEKPAPLFFVSERQINLLIPFVAIGRVDVCIGKTCELATIDHMAPAIFEYEREPGVFEPLITHLDGSLVTEENRAKNGETLVMYATGMSHNANFPLDGYPAPFEPPVEFDKPQFPLRVDSKLVPVSFAGLAPDFVGLAQFNFTLEPFVGSTTFPTGRVPVWIEADDGSAKSKEALIWVRD